MTDEIEKIIEEWIDSDITKLHHRVVENRNNTGVLCEIDDKIEALQDIRAKAPLLAQEIISMVVGEIIGNNKK
jgi:hypothetical protein